MGAFALGDVVVTEGNPGSLFSRAVMWATGSHFSHCFLVTGEDELTEATWPRVRTYSLSQRLAELAEEGRGWVSLRLPLTDGAQVARIATTFVGRQYDLLQILLFAVFRGFVLDGPLRLVCSRFVTAVYMDELTRDLFPLATVVSKAGRGNRRIPQLRIGYAAPHELVRYSAFEETGRSTPPPRDL